MLTILAYPIDFNRKLSYFLYKFLCNGILFYSGVKVKVRGLMNIKNAESYLYLSNHQSYFDIPVLMKVLPGNVRFVYKKSMTKIPIFGWAMFLAGYIPIDRKNARSAIESLRKAAKVMKKGISIVMFPEGTRSKNGEIQKFKRGMDMLASLADCDVVPISIDGTFNILPRDTFRIKPGTAYVTIAEPVKYSKDGNYLDRLREIVINNKKDF